MASAVITLFPNLRDSSGQTGHVSAEIFKMEFHAVLPSSVRMTSYLVNRNVAEPWVAS